MLSLSAARKYFGVDAPIGGVLQVDGHPMRVAAVIRDIPANSHLDGRRIRLLQVGLLGVQGVRGRRDARQHQPDLRAAAPGATAASVAAGLPGFVQRRMLPDARRYAPQLQIIMRLKPLARIHLEPADQGDGKSGVDPRVVAAIGVIAVLIVAVAVVNFVTLMTARASRRAVEVGVRKALGAQRRDLILQFMGESFLYVGVALVIALALAEIALPALNTVLSRQIVFDYLGDPGLDAAILGRGGGRWAGGRGLSGAGAGRCTARPSC